MEIALWIAQGLLAFVMLMAGLPKLTQPREKLQERMAYVEDVSDGSVKAIGGLEIVASLGLILPGIFGIATILTPLAALGVIVIQIGATVTHARRSETQMIFMNVVLILIAGFVAWGRFGDYPLS